VQDNGDSIRLSFLCVRVSEWFALVVSGLDVKGVYGGDVSDSWCRVSLPKANSCCGLNPIF
jgi:hypothetical protein